MALHLNGNVGFMNVMDEVAVAHKASADGVPALGIAGKQHAVQQSCRHLVGLALEVQADPAVGEAIGREMALLVSQVVLHRHHFQMSGVQALVH